MTTPLESFNSIDVHWPEEDTNVLFCACGNLASRLCDFDIDGVRCSAGLCRECAISPMEGLDICASHHPRPPHHPARPRHRQRQVRGLPQMSGRLLLQPAPPSVRQPPSALPAVHCGGVSTDTEAYLGVAA